MEKSVEQLKPLLLISLCEWGKESEKMKVERKMKVFLLPGTTFSLFAASTSTHSHALSSLSFRC